LPKVFDVLGSQAITQAYYLFTFFGIEAALAIAYGQRQYSDSSRARRLMLSFGGLTVIRVILFFLSFLLPNMLPPFERAGGVASLGFLLWGFAPFYRHQERIGTALLIGNTLAATIAYFLALATWDGTDFNQSSWELFFVGWQILLALFGVINCATKLKDERLYAFFSFGALLMGYVLHISLRANYPYPHHPVWIRLVELVAYPFFAVAVHQSTIYSLSTRSRELQNLSQASLDQIKGLIGLFEATKEIGASLDLTQVLDEASHSVAHALKADQCAIALPEDGADTSRLRLLSIYNPSRKGRGEAITFPLSDQPVIKNALKKKQAVQINEYHHHNQLNLLFTIMGAEDAGPLLVQPLLKQNEPIGVLLIGNSLSKRSFLESEVELSRILADQVSLAISHAHEYAAASSKAQHLSWTIRTHEVENGKRRAAMETELKKSREEVSLISLRLSEYEAAEKTNREALAQARERIARLEKTVERAKMEVEKSSQKDKQIEALTAKLEAYQQEAATLEAEQANLQKKIKLLEQETLEAERLNETLAAANERGRKLARALKKARTQGPETSPELEHLSCGVIIGDANYKVNRINAAASDMLVQPHNHLIGNDLAQIFEDKQWQRAIERLKTKEGTMISTTIRIGDNVLRATLSPMADGNGKEGTVIILYDVTPEAESQQARDEFVASLSQELRTPMTSITGYTDLLLGESVGIMGEMQRKFLQRIKANIERMGSMLSDLIGVTVIDAGQLEIRLAAVDMAEVIEDAAISARAQLEENEITLNIKLPDAMPLIEADPDSMRQVMGNLLNNAIKVTPPQAIIEITATIVAEHSSDETETMPSLTISVRDSGGGIAAKDLGRIFERFYKAERPLIEGLGETGVGLAIVKSLIEAHGGRIWAETEIGEGTIFSFSLPAYYPPDDPWDFLEEIPPLDLSAGPSDLF
jgi:signal transduction histidine kinase/GAF domain-containing protein